MSKPELRLVYDASELGLHMGSILFVAAGLLLAIFFLRATRTRRSRGGTIFMCLWMLVWATLGGVGAWNVNYQRWKCRQWARTGDYSLVEGIVEKFHPMGPRGGDKERFTVQGVEFACSDNDLSRGGFNTSSSLGGPIRGGVHVRIAYRDGRILKLWIDSPNAEIGR